MKEGANMLVRFVSSRILLIGLAGVAYAAALACRTPDIPEHDPGDSAESRETPTPSATPDSTAPAVPAAGGPATIPATDRTILPGVRVGPVSAGSSEADLISLLGGEDVLRGDIHVGEGFTEPGTILFPDSPDRVEILWEEAAFERPVAVLLADPAGPWRTPGGIGVGSPLTLLVERNGRPCKLTGFGWDYGGTVVSWEGGALSDDAALGTNCTVRVEPSREVPPEKYEQVSGDRDIRSDHPVMIEMDPRVYQLIVRIEESPDEP